MMLSQRSYTKEILDEDNIPFADIRQNMRELDFINRWLGGHDITVGAFKKLLQNKKEISICEIGCGGGDNLAAIFSWCQKKNIRLHMTGIDIKPECIEYAKSRHNLPASVKWITSDYRQVIFNHKPEIIFSSLFCHHFTEDQLVFQLRWIKENSASGFFINDLQRNPLAYYSISFLTKLFSKSYLVKNDAPLSVARGFHKKELQSLCQQAGLKEVKIDWKWAFRFLVIWQHKRQM